MKPLPSEAEPFVTGHSAFTTIRVHRGELLEWPWHVERLQETCRLLQLDAALDSPPRPDEEWEWQLCRITVTSSATHFSTRPLGHRPRPDRVEVVLTGRVVHPQWGRHKTGAHLSPTLAAGDAEAAGAFEGLLLGTEGHVVDGSRTCPVWRIADTMVVPLGGLPSVTLRRWQAESSHVWEERAVTPGDLVHAERMWLCGSGVGVLPVDELRLPGEASRQFGTTAGPQHPSLVWPTPSM